MTSARDPEARETSGATTGAVGTSIGVAVHDPASERTAEQLLREADAAVYRDRQVERPAPQPG